MPLAPKQIEEMNTVIAAIEKEVKAGMEIGAMDRAVLSSLLKTNKIEKSPKFFKCKREYSDAILKHFIKEKGLSKNRFSQNAQAFIFLI